MSDTSSLSMATRIAAHTETAESVHIKNGSPSKGFPPPVSTAENTAAMLASVENGKTPVGQTEIFTRRDGVVVAMQLLQDGKGEKYVSIHSSREDGGGSSHGTMTIK
ncbi:MAG: hypothetical protein LBD82_02265, partial [Deltaproteobacteria bacterium]|nr:hypothetical protein [Deltaproteobacteria bacterium]